MAQTVRKIPKGSWLDSDGKLWTKEFFDVMVDNGRKFKRQVAVTLGVHFDVSVGFYMLDLPFDDEMEAEIIRQNPILEGVKGMNFVPTTNRLLK